MPFTTRPAASGWVPEIVPLDHYQRPKSYAPHVEAWETEGVFTGLVTAEGDPIFRTPPPIGFGRDNEW